MEAERMGAQLAFYPEPGGPAETVAITRDPFIIGRSRSAHLTICSQKISKQHAMISCSENGFLIRDLGSTNGTFVNGQRIEEAPLVDGDIIHVAHWEYCFSLGSSSAAACYNTEQNTQLTKYQEKESVIRVSGFIEQMIRGAAVNVLFQPIVELGSGALVGFEALGRGNHPLLSQSPEKLFEHAERCHRENDLSRLFRVKALEQGFALSTDLRLFLNVHPAELEKSDFIESLARLTESDRARRQLVVEICERSVKSPAQLREIQGKLDELGIELAYDDFGAGQARLLELVECPPHFLKLDKSLIRGIVGSQQCRDLVRALLATIRDKGTQVIAEGIETEPVADLCWELGCHLGQGYLFGRPAPVLEVTQKY
jgi:EAL domain-containing protein (putative c-di-GMP-specific phosphodiesterase class I)